MRMTVIFGIIRNQLLPVVTYFFNVCKVCPVCVASVFGLSDKRCGNPLASGVVVAFDKSSVVLSVPVSGDDVVLFVVDIEY